LVRRILLSYLLIITITVGLMVAIIHQLTAATFSRYLSDQALIHSRMLPVMLAGYFTTNRSWEGIQPSIDEASIMIGTSVMLVDAQGAVVAATQRELVGQRLTQAPPQSEPLAVAGPQGAHLGMVYVGRNVAQERADQAFLDRSTSALLLTGLLVSCLALGLGLVLARSINRPLAAMSQAAQQIAQGDYSVRVTAAREGEIAVLARAFNQMAQGIGSIEQLRRELVANVSHDLRTLLTVLRGYLEGLRSGQIADRRSAELAFDAMHAEVNRLLHMVADLLQMARYDAGSLPPRRVAVAVDELFQQALRRVAPLAEAKQIELCSSPPAQPLVLTVDPEQIGQVLFNLLENGVQHTPPGGRITLSAGTEQPWAWIAVQDTGVGIGAEHLPHVFERFYRADRARSSTGEGGLGLGLAIVRAIVEAHQGQVRACSGTGDQPGSTLTIYLPL